MIVSFMVDDLICEGMLLICKVLLRSVDAEKAGSVNFVWQPRL